MSPRFEIVEAKRHHCGQMSRALRREHFLAIFPSGTNIHAELLGCFDQSSFRKAWLMDGKLAGLGGVIGTLASPSGMIWLALSEAATRYPLAIVKEARRQLDGLMGVRRELTTTVVIGDGAAIRLAVFLGFHVAHEGPGAPALSRQSRRLLNGFVETYDERILTVGKVRAVLMGYHDLEVA